MRVFGLKSYAHKTLPHYEDELTSQEESLLIFLLNMTVNFANGCLK